LEEWPVRAGYDEKTVLYETKFMADAESVVVGRDSAERGRLYLGKAVLKCHEVVSFNRE
jgi:hypothetical protein